MSVFISYRRDDGNTVAEEIYNALNAQYNVFLDVCSLKNGYFDTAIVEHIEKCSDFIFVITKTTFDRCSQQNDWIFNEAKIALQEHKNIIPVFVGLTAFPANVPESLCEICRFNGIFWSNADDACEKIKSFLISNRRYILSVTRNKDNVELSPKTKSDLKELYRRFLKNGRLPVDIKVEIQNLKDLAILLQKKKIIDDYGKDFATQIAEQSLLKKQKWINNALEFAVSYLIQDEILDTVALKMVDYYVSKYGVKDCIIKDEAGTINYALTPFVWIDIIEEMLKELLIDRWYYYGNSEKYLPIDGSIKNKNGTEIWSFCTFVQFRQDDESTKNLINKIMVLHEHVDYFEIPLCDLIFHVYPDFYYSIGLLKDQKTSLSFDVANKYKDIFNLMHYSFGLH